MQNTGRDIFFQGSEVLGNCISSPGRQTMAEMEGMLKALRVRMRQALSRHAYLFLQTCFNCFYGMVSYRKKEGPNRQFSAVL